MTDQEILNALEDHYNGQTGLAAEMTRQFGNGITRQRLSNWRTRGIPYNMRASVVQLYADAFKLSQDDTLKLMVPPNA
jgi:hypothetical protein